MRRSGVQIPEAAPTESSCNDSLLFSQKPSQGTRSALLLVSCCYMERRQTAQSFNGGIKLISIKKKLAAVALIAGVIAGSAISIAPAANAAWCNDGTWSNSSGRGTCSWHGGVEGGSKSYGNSYGSNSYGNNSNGCNSYGSNSFGGNSLSGNEYGSNSYGSNSYGNNSFGSGLSNW